MTRVRVNHRTAAGREDNHRVGRNASVTGKRFIFFLFTIQFYRSLATDRWGTVASEVERGRLRFCKLGINDERPTLGAEKRACDDRVIYVNAIVNAKRGWIFARCHLDRLCLFVFFFPVSFLQSMKVQLAFCTWFVSNLR